MPSYQSLQKFDDLTERYQRQIIDKVDAVFEEAMGRVCAEDPKLGFYALRESALFKAEWMAVDQYEDLRHDPFTAGIVNAYKHAPQASKIGILSLFAPYFDNDITCRLFDIKPWKVAQAKLHDANAMAGQPFAKKFTERMKLSPRTFAFLHQWCRSLFAVTAGDASSANYKRLEIRTRLYARYKAISETELGVDAVSEDCFMRHMRDGFVDETVETCCCQGCVDGWTAMQMLREFVSEPKYCFPGRKQLVNLFNETEQFLHGDFRWKHLRERSTEAMHCMQHALGCGVKGCSQPCDHEHTNTCVECNMFPALVSQLSEHIRSWAERKVECAQLDVVDGDELINQARAMGEGMEAHLDMLRGEVELDES
jgi:hypothetical protein